MQVHTKNGLMPIEDLEITDLTSIEGNCRVTATEWRDKATGEIVRRDVWANALTSHLIGAELATL